MENRKTRYQDASKPARAAEHEMRVALYDTAFPLTVADSVRRGSGTTHVHENWSEILIVYGGHCTYIMNGESYLVRTGDVFVVTGRSQHGYRDVQDLCRFNIGFRPEFFNPAMPEIRKMAGYHALFHLEPGYRNRQRLESRLRLDPCELKQVVDMATELGGLVRSRAQGWEFLARILFMQIVYFLCERYVRLPAQGGDRIQGLDRALAYMEAHARDRIRVGELAALAGMSNRNFLLRFKETMGLSPIDYLLHVRVGEGCSLLRHTLLPITEIALDLGFCDSNYFTRQFRRIMKMSPSEYRKRFGVRHHPARMILE